MFYFLNELIFNYIFRHGFRFVTYICEGSKLLPHLLDKFRNQRGIIVAKKVKSLEELAGHFDIVINCTGLGANEFIDDKLVHPIRGHIFRVIFYFILN